MRWLRGAIVVISALVGGWIWHAGPQNGLIAGLDRGFADWVIHESVLPKHAPTPVAIVEMEDAETWTALEYFFFLKALPGENPPVVVLETLPKEGNTAFDRVFRDLAIRVPGLILPVSLSENGPAEANPWWLDGWKSDEPGEGIATFRSVASGPPEVLRGNTAVGVANFSATAGRDLRTPAFVALGKTILPTLALRATLFSWKIAPSQIAAEPTRILREQHLPIAPDGTFLVNLDFLPGVRRIASSDLLLRLEPNAESAIAVGENSLRGIIILGDTSEAARTLTTPNGSKISRGEFLAAAVATLCNGPITVSPGPGISALLLLGAAFLPFLFLKTGPQIQVLAFLLIFAAYLPFCIFLAGRAGVVLPVVMPAAVLSLSFGLNYLARFLEIPRHE